MQSSDTIRCFSSTLLVAIIFIISCPIFLPLEAKNYGFSIDLIHRDSPQSPMYNPNLTHFQRLYMAFQRSIKRSRQIGTTSLIPDAGEYLMKISYGTPAIESFSLVDTGSGFSWIQCLPCIHCYPSESPPFNPKYSRTFQPVPCRLSKCLQANNSKNNSCKATNKPCRYEIKYLDKSYTRGERATETITVGSRFEKVSFPNFAFGCGHENVGSFPNKAAGIVGFGPQKDSFLSQLSSVNRGKFSYCFSPPVLSPGRISFGDQAVVSGPNVVSTPLIIADHYYLMVQGVGVGTRKLRYFSSNDSGMVNGGKIEIDSGATFTYLPSVLQSQVEGMLRRLIRIKPVPNPIKPFTLCYPASLKPDDIPKITFHFVGADVELIPMNTFVINSASTLCLAMLPTKNTPIFGNVAQMNLLVGYDLVKKRVSFRRIDCSKY